MTKSLVLIAAILCLSQIAVCDIFPAPPVKKDLIGAWAGCAQGCTEFYRLELKPDGTGSFVLLAPDLTHDAYVISDWALNSEGLRITLKALGGAEQIEVKSLRVDSRYVEIEIQSRIGKWKRAVTLYNEKDWDDRTRRAREASARAQAR